MEYIFGMAIAAFAFIGLIYLFFKLGDKFGTKALLFIIIPIAIIGIILLSFTDGLSYLFGFICVYGILRIGIHILVDKDLREKYKTLAIILIIVSILIFLIFYLPTFIETFEELKTLGVIIIIILLIALTPTFEMF